MFLAFPSPSLKPFGNATETSFGGGRGGGREGGRE